MDITMSSGSRHSRKIAIAAFAALLALGMASAGHAAATYHGLAFPDQIAGAELGPVTDFEQTKPGLGYGVRYGLPGWTIDIYIYDDGRPSIPDDPASDVLKNHLQQAKGDILELQRRGNYAKVELIREHVMSDASGRPRLLCADFAYTHQQNGDVDSFLCLAGWHDKFVKFRLTSGEHPGADAEAKRFIEAWLPILWP